MGCNAYNHSRFCNCGWGGANHLPARSSPPTLRFIGYGSYNSFTIPNARCPVCGDSVFFYRSPNGGSVFFDDLGPPWPKHPCTEGNFTKRPQRCRPPKAYTIENLECEKDGWLPIQITEIASTSAKEIVKISFSTSQSSQSVYLAFKQNLLDRSAPWLIKLINDNGSDGGDCYLVQTLVSSGTRIKKIREVELRAYRQISAAQFVRNRRRAPADRKLHEREIAAVSRSKSRPVAHSVRLTTTEKKVAVEELLIKLKEQYAVIREFRPLPSGIEKQITRKDPSLPKDILQHALMSHRNSIEYLTHLIEGCTYFQIDGTVGGRVSEKHIQDALQQLNNKKNSNSRATTNLLPLKIGLTQNKLDALIEKFNRKHKKLELAIKHPSLKP